MFDKNQFLDFFQQNGINTAEAENIFNHASEWLGGGQNPQEIMQNLTDWTNQHAGEFENVQALLNFEQSQGFLDGISGLLGLGEQGEGIMDGIMESLGGLGDLGGFFGGGGDSE